MSEYNEQHATMLNALIGTDTLANHDKQIVENTFKVLNQTLKDLGKDTIPRWILDGVADEVRENLGRN